MKRKANSEGLGDVIKKLIKSYGYEEKYEKFEAIAAFKKHMGPNIENYIEQTYIKDDKLFVELNSAVLREELSMGKSKIIAMINEEIGKEVIKELIFT